MINISNIFCVGIIEFHTIQLLIVEMVSAKPEGVCKRIIHDIFCILNTRLHVLSSSPSMLNFVIAPIVADHLMDRTSV